MTHKPADRDGLIIFLERVLPHSPEYTSLKNFPVTYFTSNGNICVIPVSQAEKECKVHFLRIKLSRLFPYYLSIQLMPAPKLISLFRILTVKYKYERIPGPEQIHKRNIMLNIHPRLLRIHDPDRVLDLIVPPEHFRIFFYGCSLLIKNIITRQASADKSRRKDDIFVKNELYEKRLAIRTVHVETKEKSLFNIERLPTTHL